MTKNLDTPAQVSPKETEIILDLLKQTLVLPGDVVEFGCYKADTSLLLAKILQSTDKKLFLYDSFEGLPEKSREDFSPAGTNFKAGELNVSKREVIEKFKRSGLHLHPIIKKSFFENLDTKTDLPEKICFGFLDGDLYSSIKTSLRLTAPKVTPGGILIVHDYNNPELPGSAKAVDEWLNQNPATHFAQRESLAILKF